MIAMTNSERSVLTSCEQLWLLRYGLGLAHVGVVSRSLQVGRVWHEVMSAYWGGMASSLGALTPLERATGVVRDVFAGLERDAQRSGFSTNREPVDYTVAEVAEMRSTVEAMLAGYDDSYGHERRRVLMNETRLRAVVDAPSGCASWCRYEGTLDKLEEDDYGERWIVEHKTSSRSLKRWRDGNAYRPQAPGYAWLISRACPKLRPSGVMYDLALTQSPPPDDALAVVGKGTPKNPLRLSKVVPDGFSASQYRRALEVNGFGIGDQPYYAQSLAKLEQFPTQYFMRVYMRFDAADVERVGREIYHVATRARRFRERTEPVRFALLRLVEERGDVAWRIAAAEWLRENGHDWPRNGFYCKRYGRTCRFFEVCRYWSVEALGEFEPRASYHPEQDDDEKEATK